MSFYDPQVPRWPAIPIKKEADWEEIHSETEDPEEIRVLFKRWRAAGRGVCRQILILWDEGAIPESTSYELYECIRLLERLEPIGLRTNIQGQ